MSGKLFKNLTYFLDYRTQRTIENHQYTLWAKVEAGFLYGSVLVPPLVLTYISNSESLASYAELLADDTSLFSVVENINKIRKQERKEDPQTYRPVDCQKES